MRKQLTVTGIANETNFDNPDAVKFLIVFNNGELRIPISDEATRKIIQFILGNDDTDKSADESDNSPEEDLEDNSSHFDSDEEGVDQI